jgi:hypothetical protein
VKPTRDQRTRSQYVALVLAGLAIAGACSGTADVVVKDQGKGGGDGEAGEGTGGTSARGGTGGTGGTIIPPDTGNCQPVTCTELGWECGYFVDPCDNVTDCEDEGLTCAENEVCTGGLDSPTECVTGGGSDCPVCTGIPDCGEDPDDFTRLSGRVITPGRDDGNTGNQVGVPNAIVYLLRTNDPRDLPDIPTGIPADGESCDRCEDQLANLGPVLAGAVTDATGAFTIEQYVPLGIEVLLVVKAGRFRRATTLIIPEDAACQTTDLPTDLPDNPTRLPRDMSDGLAVNIPLTAVTTGRIDAMECVLEKMGISHPEFTNPGGDGRIQLFRGGPNNDPSGARIDGSTPHADTLYGDIDTMLGYDLVVSDCEGQHWDSDFEERDAMGDSVREFVNRGGRMFASHLSFSWLHENGMAPYDDMDPIATGLGPAGTWDPSTNTDDSGRGAISIGRPNESPRIQNFADWMVNEGVTTAPDYEFDIIEPRSQNLTLGPSSEEFVHLLNENERTQQFSFNTPYGAPDEAACGRVAYSGFHVTVGGGSNPFEDVVFPEHCMGDLTDQEKVLLYMLFDLSSCIGDVPPPPPCVPLECDDDSCGFAPDGCGGVLDCGPCMPPVL